ncbi:DUF2306 domain-containing protein [Devosia sp.]|uniref:DUF2306 domain-containing protein n=1 Tax=Devosia sp. TaxID=1871048 RepID=UPI0019E8275F|nr:DUF2306 domain-containing protein [Devosia sp.]MBE0577825.1 DUF2306 domain-containing protein [Devosia sp.]
MSSLWSLLRRVPWSLWAVLSVGVALFSYRYVVGIGPFPEEITGNLFAFPWLSIHAAAASTALLVAPLQFIARLRKRFPRIHRITGRLYVVACVIGGLTGLPLAWGATAGPIATAGFGILAILWLWTTMVAWRLAVDGRFAEHRRWMIRSIALTAAGVMLRVYLGIMLTLPVEFYEGYRVIAFLCWVPNILLAELYLRRGQRVSAPAAA